MLAALAVLANISALSPIYFAETNKRRNSAVFLALLMGYGLAHALTSTEYTVEPYIASDNPVRYARIDYTLVVLFILFSDEFHALSRDYLAEVSLIAIGFLVSDGAYLFGATLQWTRLIHCAAQCTWRVAFFSLIRRLQQHAYKIEE